MGISEGSPLDRDLAATRPRVSAVRWWLGMFGALFLMFAGWSLAAPYNGTPDEHAHMIRAAGVVGGQVAPPAVAAVHGAGAYQTVPAGLVRDTTCWIFRQQRSAACAVPPGADRTPRRVATAAGRYQPAYYALVGAPLRLWPGWPGVLLARLLSAAASAALLAAALVTLLRRCGRGYVLAAFLIVLTPMAAQMASAVNPSGLEIAAGISLFAAALALMRDGAAGSPGAVPGGLPVRAARVPRGPLALATVSAAIVALMKTTGPLYLLVALCCLAIPLRRAALRRALADRAVRISVLVVGAAVAASAAWIVLMRETELGTYRYGRLYTRGQALMLVIEKWRSYLDEMVGVTSWLDTRMTMPAYLVWQAAAATLILVALVIGARRDRARMMVLAAAGAGIPTVMQLIYVRRTGFILQGRYMLPLLAGVVLLAGHTLQRRLGDRPPAATAVRAALLLLLPIHLLCLVYTMARWQNGLPGPGGLGPRRVNPLAGTWHPVLGSGTVLLIEVVALLLVALMVRRALAGAPAQAGNAAGRPAGVAPPAPGPVTAAAGSGVPVPEVATAPGAAAPAVPAAVGVFPVGSVPAVGTVPPVATAAPAGSAARSVPGTSGTPGAVGPAGTPGAVGPAGTPGAVGPAGTPGVPGTPGTVGPAGAAGGPRTAD